MYCNNWHDISDLTDLLKPISAGKIEDTSCSFVDVKGDIVNAVLTETYNNGMPLPSNDKLSMALEA